ncbi:glycosyl transferase [Luteitalea sp. TBR-22]|uniref:glycosyltransferase n=1 Tax=Luteitalea sp. TBR-22 TaxID=2802971 RepID=UPI001AF8552E|nr:glycosyltransferase [Luteitalea sp. TBR-22]BCS36061.1 glycosyl transferase [Luteitalea sp. TBR-22]
MISAIVCTHNPRMEYLNRVLNALSMQELEKSLWELLVIDNGSSDPLEDRLELGWHPQARVITEHRLGLTHARFRGIAESRGETLLFIDDDNVLDPGYLQACCDIASEWPQLGAWGGAIVPEFEKQPEPDVVPFLSALALRDVTRATWTNVRRCSSAEPWGAGLCVRRQVAEAYVTHLREAPFQILDRVGGMLLSGGDTEMCFVACESGMGMGLFPSLKVTHLIPERRVEPSYIVAISKGLAASEALMSFKWDRQSPEAETSFSQLFRCLKRMILAGGRLERRVHWARYRGRVEAARMYTARINLPPR